MITSSRTKTMTECFFCHRNGENDPLDRHHVFGKYNRYKSEKYGLVVYLCHRECHIFGRDSIHGGTTDEAKRRREALNKWGEQKWLDETGGTVEDFIREFGRNYL